MWRAFSFQFISHHQRRWLYNTTTISNNYHSRKIWNKTVAKNVVQILFNEWLEEIFKIGQKNFVKLPETFRNLLLFLRFWERKHYSVYRGLKVNVHNTLKRCPECLLNVSCSFSLRCVFRGTTLILIFDGSLKYKASNNLLENTFMKSA